MRIIYFILAGILLISGTMAFQIVTIDYDTYSLSEQTNLKYRFLDSINVSSPICDNGICYVEVTRNKIDIVRKIGFKDKGDEEKNLIEMEKALKKYLKYMAKLEEVKS